MALMLVTGGAGFIGSHLVEELLGRGETVLPLAETLPPLPGSPYAASKLALEAEKAGVGAP